MKFDVTYAGKVMQGTNVYVYSIRANGVFAAVNIEDTLTRVVLTGYTATSARGNVHYETTGGGWIYLPDGWTEIGTVAVAQYSDSAAQALIDKIISNNQNILRGNLLCARYASRFTPEQQAAIRGLQQRLDERNEALQADGLTKDIRTGYPVEYAELSGYLDALMKGEAIGAIATWAIIVIAAVVAVGMGTAAYFAYKNLADESERDLKYSKELTQTLVSKLTPEEYQQLLEETKGMLTKSKIKSLFSGGWGVLTWITAGVGAYVIYRIIKEKI